MIETVTKNYVDGIFQSYQVTYVNSNREKSVPIAEASLKLSHKLKIRIPPAIRALNEKIMVTGSNNWSAWE